jgi:hypothetical protein
MAFDQSTRNRLQKFVSNSRTLLSEEFTRQLQNDYGLDPSMGTVSPLENLGHLDDTRRETARILRDTLAHYLASSPSGGVGEALDRIIREQAFTVLNRLSALRMTESRGILIESVGNGYKSKGFQLYERLAGSGLGETGDTYRCYLFSIFDEFALDLKVLFDRFSPQGRLFPRETVLLDLLKLLNDPELAHLWAEDETIGWIYQYFNSKEERKKMRDESAAPRNSRELAVRNQFFTPRYVVEFLTDNTLGRIWYEMTQGETGLKDFCRYLVRRPAEIFLKPSEAAPVQASSDENLSQEELLRQPVHIPHRPLKDPRTIRMLDPACGSMHFGLYSFDLFERIYEEAWGLELRLGGAAFVREAGLKTLTETYPDKEAFVRDVPRLIIEYNIHGIDIDPRAVQIAGLSLWLRAQRRWHNLGVKPTDRPRITRSNIVCAEPMPGEKELLREFTARLEEPALGYLLEQVFDKMQLAGEAGSLLKIEEEIRDIIAEAKRRWKAVPKLKQIGMFGDAITKLEQAELPLDFASITDERFWEGAEEKLYQALQEYSEVAGEHGYQRLLFVEDAARGFAFIDLCRKRYDVVLMNPPFGDLPLQAVNYLVSSHPHISDNLLCAFLERARNKTNEDGCYGAIFDRTASIKSSYEDFRRSEICGRIITVADTGWEVLDANVETTVHVLAKNLGPGKGVFFDVLNTSSNCKANDLHVLIQRFNSSLGEERTYCRDSKIFVHLPNVVIGYYFDDSILRLFSTLPSLQETGKQARQGHSLAKAEHKRLFWEIPTDAPVGKEKAYCVLYNGGDFSLFYSPYRELTVYGPKARLVVFHPSVALRNLQYQFIGGVGYGKRGEYLDAHLLRADSIFTDEGQAISGMTQVTALLVLSFLNSILAQHLINTYCGQHKHSGYINRLPFPKLEEDTANKIRQNALEILTLKLFWLRQDETCNEFCSPLFAELKPNGYANLKNLLYEIKERLHRDQSHLEERIGINDDIFLDSAGLSFYEKVKFAEYRVRRPSDKPWADYEADLAGGSEDRFLTIEIVSQSIGCAIGRWDIRFAAGDKPMPALWDLFAPLPVCPLGQLQNDQGLPILQVDIEMLKEKGRWNYPIEIPWAGILVDDPGHPFDLEARVHQVLQVIWEDRWEVIERESCEFIGVRILRDFFAKPSGFFADHLKRYSKSRRQAPIYWPLSTASGSYTLWIYYHRLNDQTIYTCVNDFVEPKLRDIAIELITLRQNGIGRSRDDEKKLGNLQDFEIELHEFRDELLRLARLPWKPNLNDGVQITAAPLWKLFQLPKWKKTLKETWEKLEKGDYDWAHLAYSIWPDRVREKCKKDKSLAIAHNLEELYEEPPASAKKKRSKKAVVV